MCSLKRDINGNKRHVITTRLTTRSRTTSDNENSYHPLKDEKPSKMMSILTSLSQMKLSIPLTLATFPIAV